MMAGLFFLFSLAMIAIPLRFRSVAMGLIWVSLILSIAMLYHHATDTLQIRV